jgi:hypothetical protein
MAQCANKISAYGKKYPSSKMHVIEPAGKAFDAALRLGAIGHCRRDLGQLGTLAGDDTADHRSQGGQVPRAPALGFTWIRLSEGLSYGTILAEVVTHRLRLLDGARFPESIYDRATS